MPQILTRNFGLMAASALVAALLGTSASPLVATAQSSGLEGSWGGGGRIVFPSGETERASCRARFRHRGGNSYYMSAICATASTRVQQTAEIRRVGGNVYRGDFFNEEHGIAGHIRITVSGSRLSASLKGGGGSAHFSLRR
ncbi:MAG: hypothetical protein R3D44_06305 [Hyphomicrobiaceae bacterium]